MTSASQKTFFNFLVIACDRVGDGEKSSYKNFGRGRTRFHATVSHLKIEAKHFFSKALITQCN